MLNRTKLNLRTHQSGAGKVIVIIVLAVLAIGGLIIGLSGEKPEISVYGEAVIKNGSSERYRAIAKFSEVQSEQNEISYDELAVYEANGWNVQLSSFDMRLRELHVYARGSFSLECTDKGALKGNKGEDSEGDFTYSIFVDMGSYGQSDEKSIRCVTEEEYAEITQEAGEDEPDSENE